MRYDRTVIAYHGCDAGVAERLLRGEPFHKSENDYDWLGAGVYFWEYGAILNTYFVSREHAGDRFDTVRCGFTEGARAFPGSGIFRESHIQIAVRNPAYILGVFRPTL